MLSNPVITRGIIDIIQRLEINKKDHNSAEEREEADIGAHEARRKITTHAEVVNARTKIKNPMTA